MLASNLKTLAYKLCPIGLAYLAQIEQVAKAIERITAVLEHSLHHVFLAAIQAIAYMRLQLPYATQLFLECQRIGVFSYLLELVYAHHYSITLLLCYQLRQTQHLLGCVVAGIVLKRYREIIVRIHTETNLWNKTAKKHLGVLHPFLPFGGSSTYNSCGKRIYEVGFRTCTKSIYTRNTNIIATNKRAHAVDKRSLTHTTRRNKYGVHSVSEIGFKTVGLYTAIGESVAFYTYAKDKGRFEFICHKKNLH